MPLEALPDRIPGGGDGHGIGAAFFDAARRCERTEVSALSSGGGGEYPSAAFQEKSS